VAFLQRTIGDFAAVQQSKETHSQKDLIGGQAAFPQHLRASERFRPFPPKALRGCVKVSRASVSIGHFHCSVIILD
jgi:hypothetical protein